VLNGLNLLDAFGLSSCLRAQLGQGSQWNRFRRSFATTLSKQGYSLAKIARLLGHSSASMTTRYVE
jgi:site-specific recombinase XerD